MNQDQVIPDQIKTHNGLDRETECRFLAELTALSQKYRLGIAGDAVLFIMEWDDDGRVYTSNDESKLLFR